MKLAATITRFLQADMQAELRGIEGVLYLNDGDWVESCSALVEHADGRLEILEWARQVGLGPRGVPVRPVLDARRLDERRSRPDAHFSGDQRLTTPGERRRAHTTADQGGV